MKLKLPSTFSVLATLGIAAAAWECWTIVDRERGKTFSATIAELAENQPVIAAGCGALMRHLFHTPRTRAAYHSGYAGGEFWPLKDKRDV